MIQKLLASSKRTLSSYTRGQIIALIVTNQVAAATSIIGSIYIVQDVLRDPHKRRESIYHRVMLGVACSDFIYAMPIFLSTWPMPKGIQLFAVGNEGVCKAVGFFLSLGFTLSPLYSCSLATYYLLQLKCRWNDQKMTDFEKWMHVLPWVLGLVSPLTALLTNTLGPRAYTCVIKSGFAVLLSSILYVAATIYVIVVMSMVYRYIRNIEVRAQSYTFSGRLSRMSSQQSTQSPSRIPRGISRSSATSQAAERKRSRRVMIQGVMYAIAMLLVFLPIFIEFFFIRDKEIFASQLVTHILTPSQGFFNAFIYSGLLQRWFYNNDGQCRCCARCSRGSINTVRRFVSSVRSSVRATSSIIFTADNNDKDAKRDRDEESKEEIQQLNPILVVKKKTDKTDSNNNDDSGASDQNKRSSNYNGQESQRLTTPMSADQCNEDVEKVVDCVDDTVEEDKAVLLINESQKRSLLTTDFEALDAAEQGAKNVVESGENEEEKEEIMAQFPIHSPSSLVKGDHAMD